MARGERCTLHVCPGDARAPPGCFSRFVVAVPRRSMESSPYLVVLALFAAGTSAPAALRSKCERKPCQHL